MRETPWSHKPGFLKGALSDALETVGIEYVQTKFAGNPKRHHLISLPQDTNAGYVQSERVAARLEQARSFRNRAFDRAIHAFEPVIRSFQRVIRSFQRVIHSFDRVIHPIEAAIHSFEREICSFAPVTCPFEGVVRSFDRAICSSRRRRIESRKHLERHDEHTEVLERDDQLPANLCSVSRFAVRGLDGLP